MRRELLVLAGRVSRPERAEQVKLRKAFRRRDRDDQRAHDRQILAATGIRVKRGRGAFAQLPPHVEPPPSQARAEFREVRAPRNCYVCKADYAQVHFFYDSMCPPCATLNYGKRHPAARLDGRVALVTGARVKIGYQLALMLLRAGARVIATTRFPRDAARRYAREPDFEAFAPRLLVYGLDLRHTPSVELFARHIEEKFERLDVLLNNAAQTVRRPAGFYAHLVAAEQEPCDPGAKLLASHDTFSRALTVPGGWDSARMSQLQLLAEDADPRPFPVGRLDGDLQQIDTRDHNSWRMTADAVPTPELLETHLVNAIAPFLLCARLRRLMEASPSPSRYIVNVSAMEAQFSRGKKTDRHPHTNMAKAALNMLTRTSAADYADSRIYMNSVDTGWVTDEDPLMHATRKTEVHGFHPPLDAVDGAARVLDPIVVGELTGKPPWGCFFKDYRVTSW
jgi:NAD(P)-dependent dehydrogenase (short-subunit alcohol dehydrogenase family)